jgi:hypothetical protein
VYLSDPFFRNLIGPAYRAEMTRRMRAQTDNEMYLMAGPAARAEGLADPTVEKLVAEGFLPEGFGKRPDGSRMTLAGGEPVDSLRGARGSFLPVPDVEIAGLTASEAEAYDEFAKMYRQQWERMDPAIFALSRKPATAPGRERLVLDLYVSPYAKRHYQLFADHLDAPEKRRTVPLDKNLLSIDLVFKLPEMDLKTPLRVFGGLAELTVPFSIERGELKPKDFDEKNFSGYGGAWFGKNEQALEGVRGLIGSPEGEPDKDGYQKIDQHAWQLKTEGRILIAPNKDLLAAWGPQIKLADAERPAQLRLALGDLSQSKLYAFLNAGGYLQVRRVSEGNARFLNNLAVQLHLRPEEVLRRAEAILGARLVCPLGGVYAPAKEPGAAPAWGSSAWKEPSLLAVKAVPEGYRFPALDWLRALELEFSIDPQALATHIELEVQSAKAPQ